MEATDVLSQADFARQHFGQCDFGDARLTRRAQLSAAEILRHPGGTLPDKLRTHDLLAFYRMANNSKVTHEKMLQGHRQWVFDQLRQRVDVVSPPVVLLISDTTEVDFTGLSSAELGPIGNGGGWGLLCHNVLAYDFGHCRVIGLANQLMHKRRNVKKGETAKQRREHPQRESRLWKNALMDLPAPPRGQLRVNIADRGSDAFENIKFWESRDENYVIRSKSSRKMEEGRLHDWARGLARSGRRVIDVAENHGQSERMATVEIAFSPLILPAPMLRRGEYAEEPSNAWVIHVREIAGENAESINGSKPLEWILLTNVPVNNVGQAWERVEWYRRRPVVEELHKGMKTGCGVELLQFTTRGALEVSIALLSIVAVQLLRMRDMSRDGQIKDDPAAGMIDPIYVEVLSVMRFKKKQPLSVSQFFQALAYLGGHLNRKTDKPPGWLVLWRGWSKLQPMVSAVEADRRSRCV
jgi:Transposase DNA-binding/Transposase DDE domain